MSLISDMRLQKAVWWQRQTADQFGNFTFAGPVEIDCRWEDVAKEFRDSNGEQQISSSIVYVDRDMKVGDRLMLGEMPSDVEEDPMDEPLAYMIKRFDKLPDFSNTENLLTAYL